jgi:hypothetical protein
MVSINIDNQSFSLFADQVPAEKVLAEKLGTRRV